MIECVKRGGRDYSSLNRFTTFIMNSNNFISKIKKILFLYLLYYFLWLKYINYWFGRWWQLFLVLRIKFTKTKQQILYYSLTKILYNIFYVFVVVVGFATYRERDSFLLRKFQNVNNTYLWRNQWKLQTNRGSKYDYNEKD